MDKEPDLVSMRLIHLLRITLFPLRQMNGVLLFDPDAFYECTWNPSYCQEDAAHGHTEKWLRFCLCDIVHNKQRPTRLHDCYPGAGYPSYGTQLAVNGQRL
jgi:hypothetical protein